MTTTCSVTDILDKTIADFETGSNQEIRKQLTGTGFHTLDDFIGGFHKNSLTVIAGRPGMGKSALTLSMAYNIATQGTPVVYISAERTSQMLLFHLTAAKTDTPLHESTSSSANGKQLETLKAIKKQLNIPLFFSGKRAKDIEEVIDDCKQFVQQGIEVIFIDCLQLLTWHGKVDTVEFDIEEPSCQAFNITKPLFKFAFENNVALVTTSQVSTCAETRGGPKRPEIYDMKWSHYLEDIADTVLLIYRPEYYGFIEDEEDNSTEGIAELIVAKNRCGRRGTCHVKFDSQTGWFSELKN